MVTVRRGAPADAPDLARLRYRLRTEAVDEVVEDEPTFVARCEPWLRDRLAGSDWRTYVADAGGQVVGTAFVRLVEKMPNPNGGSDLLGYLTSVYVAPEHRDRGVGTSLLARVVADARAEGWDTVVVWPTERSVPLYRRAGFAAPPELLELPADAAARDTA